MIFCRDDLKSHWLLFLMKIFQPLEALQIKVASFFARSVKCYLCQIVFGMFQFPLLLESGSESVTLFFSPLGSFTSVTPDAPWPSAWGRPAPWRKAASSPPSFSKSSSRRCYYHTSWLWAWGKMGRELKTEFSFTPFTVSQCTAVSKTPHRC